MSEEGASHYTWEFLDITWDPDFTRIPYYMEKSYRWQESSSSDLLPNNYRRA